MALHSFITALLKATAARPALSAGTPDDARRLVTAGRAALGESAAVHDVAVVLIETRSGTCNCLLIRPNAGTPKGLVIYVHGGGWVVGSIKDFEIYARALARSSGCAVLLVGYRLAPEHRHPAGLEDVEDAFLWAQAQMQSLFGADLPMVVAGDSAGANLVTVALRRLGPKVKPILQVLNYPVTDSDMTRPSYVAHGAGLTLTARDMAWFFDHYSSRADRENPDISPLQATDLSHLPPTVITLASHDVLHDEGRAYAARLRDAGVPVTLRVVDGVTHGFIRLHNLFDISAQELETVAGDIAAACVSALRTVK